MVLNLVSFGVNSLFFQVIDVTLQSSNIEGSMFNVISGKPNLEIQNQEIDYIALQN